MLLERYVLMQRRENDASDQERERKRAGGEEGKEDYEGEIDRLAGRSFSLSKRRDRARSLINDNGRGLSFSLFLPIDVQRRCVRAKLRGRRETRSLSKIVCRFARENR